LCSLRRRKRAEISIIVIERQYGTAQFMGQRLGQLCLSGARRSGDSNDVHGAIHIKGSLHNNCYSEKAT
jgi:hypothetical protein